MRLAAIAALLVGGCVSQATVEPVSRPAPGVPRDELYRRAMSVLSDHGWSAATNDVTSGVIVTEWEETSTLGVVTRIRWHVRLSNGNVRVDSSCQVENESAFTQRKTWDECGPGTHGDQRMKKARALAVEIAQSNGSSTH